MPTDVPTQVFRDWGKDNGFRRRGTTLYRDQEETIAVVNLQGSRYSGRYQLNVALWLKAVGDEPTPKVYDCHLRTRLTTLRSPDASEADEAYLDLDSSMSDDERSRQFREALDSLVTPALSKTGTLVDLKANPGVVRRFLVDKDAYRLGLRGPARPVNRLFRWRHSTGLEIDCGMTRVGRFTFRGLDLAMVVTVDGVDSALMFDTGPRPLCLVLEAGKHALTVTLTKGTTPLSSASAGVEVPPASWVAVRCVATHGRVVSAQAPDFHLAVERRWPPSQSMDHPHHGLPPRA